MRYEKRNAIVRNRVALVLKLGPVLLAEFGDQVVDKESGLRRQIAPAEIHRVDTNIEIGLTRSHKVLLCLPVLIGPHKDTRTITD